MATSLDVPGQADLTVGAPQVSPASAPGAAEDGSAARNADPSGGSPTAAELPPAPTGSASAAPSPRPTTAPPAAKRKAAGDSSSARVPTATKPVLPKATAATPRPRATGGAAPVRTAAEKAPAPPPLLLGPGTPTADEAEVIRLVNVERAAAGCQALRVSPVLTQVARAHSQNMSATDGFRHNGPDGRTPFQRLIAVGYDYLLASENIAAGQPTPAAVVGAWMAGKEHEDNILDCRFTEIGVGKAYVPGSQFGTYWTQDLATPM